ncbi:MAG: UbiX family flavin prenyltransferase [Desulfobulbaceae bacterium]|nr:MAG: UbiX family flavin prenyltransferase [Desulfobulbaceae bacterium]
MENRKKILVGVTGATGSLYLHAFLRMSRELTDLEIHGICSEAGEKVVNLELGMAVEKLPGVSSWFGIENFAAPCASGSSDYQAMVVLPCTMGSLAAIATGQSINLIHRSADVMLKERKKLILGVRETPFNRNHLENMLRAHDAGAIIFPPMVSYYLKPQSLEEAADMFSWRIYDHLGITIPGRKRWQG